MAERVRSRLNINTQAARPRERNSDHNLPVTDDVAFQRLSKIQNEMRIQRLETRVILMQSAKARRKYQRRLREEAKRNDLAEYAKICV